MVHHEVKKAKKIGHYRRVPKHRRSLLLIGFVVLIFLVAGFLTHWTFPVKTHSVDAVAYVNGVPISRSTFEAQWDSLPPQTKLKMNRSELLNQMVTEELLLQKAVKENISISDAEVDNFISSQLAKTGMSLDQYKKLLASQGYSFDNIRETYRKQLMVAKLFDSTVASNISVSPEEIQSYYDSHKKDFYHGDEVTVRHLLIQVSKNFNDSQARELVDKLIDSLNLHNNSNFCQLVANYSMDAGSKDDCGQYTFARGVMVPEFENASFNMTPGERRVIKSPFGYHIIIKMKDIPAGFLSLNDTMTKYPSKPTVAEYINQTLTQEKAKSIFDDYVKKLMTDANVVYADEDLSAGQDSSRS